MGGGRVGQTMNQSNQWSPTSRILTESPRSVEDQQRGGKKKIKARIVGHQKWTQSTFDLHTYSIKYIISLLISRQLVIVSVNIFLENQSLASSCDDGPLPDDFILLPSESCVASK